MIVKGLDVVVYILDGVSWKPFACARSCSLSFSTDVIETSVSGTGWNATFTPSKNSFSGSIAGICSLEEVGQFTLPMLQQLQFAHTGLFMRFQRVSIGGQIYTTEAKFLITEVNEESSFDNLNTFSIQLKGTGNVTQIFVITPDPLNTCKVKTYDYTGIGGEDNFTPAAGLLVNKSIVGAFKDGVEFRIISSGTPASKEVKYTSSTGNFLWSIPFETGEPGFIQYQDI